MIPGRSLYGAAMLVTVVASSPAAAQRLPEPAILRFDGCVDRLDVDEVRARVALELTEHPRGDLVHVQVSCASSEATITVVEEGETRAELAVDLGDTEGTARAWALALVVSDLLRRSTPEATAASASDARPAAEAPTAPAAEPPSSTVASEGASRRLSSPIGRSVVRAAPVDAEAATDHAGARSSPMTWLGLGASGRITFDGPTAAAGASLSIRHDWFRVGLSVSGSHRGASLGQVAAGLLLLDVAALPLRHVEGAFSLAGEVFVHGGAIYGAGIPASPSIDASDTVAALVGFGIGARVFLDGSVGMELGLRAGYEVVGAELRAAASPLMRFYGLFASLDLALALPLG